MKKTRVSIFIDGSNLYNNLKQYKINKKFQEIIEVLVKEGDIADIFYYTASLDITFNEEKYWKHQRFLGKLREIPKFNVVLCTLKKSIEKDGSTKFTIKGDDVCLANDLIKGAYEDLYDIAIIVSGDEDFIPAIKTVQTLNKKVINAFFHKSSSNALRSICNNCINLGKELKK